LVVWALDRLSREGIARMSGYLEKLKACGVRVLSHQEPWLDTSGPVADLLVAIFGWVAQQERERIRERILAGLARARSQGKRLGRPKFNLDHEEIKARYFELKSLRKTAMEFGCNASTIHRILGI